MKIYKVCFSDRHGEYHGSLADKFTNEEAAEKAMKWHDSHPMPYDPGVLHFWIETIDTSDAKDEFVPPMTEERYKEMCDECYPEQDYPDDYDDYDFPGPSEEELAKYRETEALANELQEKMAEVEEQRKRENAELVDKAIDLCEEILGKGKYELLA